mgnify:CR=1 FL=1
MRQTSEPTVEEILESIKKVIARDNRAGAAEERRHRETAGMPTAPVREPEGLAIEDDVLDLAESAEEVDLAEPQDDAAEPRADAPLLTEHAQANMRDSLAALAMLSTPPAQPQIVRSGETSLEGLARDLLRPALAEWLDKNLPPLVERLVAAEIARIVGKRG